MRQAFTSTALAALMLGAATPVLAQSAEAVRSYDIPAGPLDRALPAFAQQSGLQLLYPTALAAGRWSAGVSGAHTAETALGLLLRDTGLTYRQSRPTVFVLIDPAARAQEDAATPVLDEVVVTGTYLRGADSPSPVTVLICAWPPDWIIARSGSKPRVRTSSPARRPGSRRRRGSSATSPPPSSN